MYCRKKEERNIYNLFTIYKCDGCPYYLDREEILIGTNKIVIVPIVKRCKDDLIPDTITLFNKRLIQIFKEIEEHQEDDFLFLWVDNVDDVINYNIDFFDAILLQGIDIYIIY